MKRAMMFGLALSLSTSALAQQDEPAPQPDAEPQVTYKPVTELIFDNLEIGATVEGPGVIHIAETARAVFPPMIRLRTDFNAEMSDSADDVK